MQETPSTARVALKWGLIAGVVSMIYSTALYMTSQFTNNALTWLALLISVTFIVLAMREFRTLNGGFMTYGEGVGLGTLVATISGMLSATYSYFYMNFIDTTIMQQIMDQSRVKMEEQGMSDDQIEQALEVSQNFMSPGLTFLFGVLGSVFFGLILSLIIAAFMRRNKPFAEFQ